MVKILELELENLMDMLRFVMQVKELEGILHLMTELIFMVVMTMTH